MPWSATMPSAVPTPTSPIGTPTLPEALRSLGLRRTAADLASGGAKSVCTQQRRRCRHPQFGGVSYPSIGGDWRGLPRMFMLSLTASAKSPDTPRPDWARPGARSAAWPSRRPPTLSSFSWKWPSLLVRWSMNPFRLTSVLRGMADNGIPQMIVSDPAAIFYLTGTWIHPGERMLALRLSLTGRHALFVNELFSVPENLGVETIWFNDTQDGA